MFRGKVSADSARMEYLMTNTLLHLLPLILEGFILGLLGFEQDMRQRLNCLRSLCVFPIFFL